MRFDEDGPSIPDVLLIARDEGRVIFFCGSGVSIHKAELPNFIELAEKVAERLGASEHAEAAQLLRAAVSLSKAEAAGSAISADRIFGALEWEFGEQATNIEVAKALKPQEGVDIGAHQIMVDLSGTPDGRLQLVTTNFDLLFQECTGVNDPWVAPALPDPSIEGGFDRIVYLHGRVNEDYTDTDGPGFVVATSEFGRAYLSEGWATEFFRAIIEKYYVVFIGYAADDPPIRYLLEAFQKTRGSLRQTYAFTEAGMDEGWRQKGVESIVYRDFDDLWSCLDSWAFRARDPLAWLRSVVEQSLAGPRKLKAHQRGQVAHILSTTGGSRVFAEYDSPPPAEWLCVLDPRCRFAKPGKIWGDDEEGLEVNPLDYYGLDSDTRLVAEDTGNDIGRRFPEDVWNGLSNFGHDYLDIDDRHISSLRGAHANSAASLTPRQNVVANWIGRVYSDPHTLWWAAQQEDLHSTVRSSIRRSISTADGEISSDVARGWESLFEFWDSGASRSRHDWYQFKSDVHKLGWFDQSIRRLAEITRPYLKVSARTFRPPLAPELEKSWPLNDVMTIEVGHPECEYEIEIPDSHVPAVVHVIKQNLDLAERLEREASYPQWSEVSSLIDDSDLGPQRRPIQSDLSELSKWFASLYSLLLDRSREEAFQEYMTWPRSGSKLFAHLRVWAAGYLNLISGNDFAAVVQDLERELFWSPGIQRDLLLSISERWAEIDQGKRSIIEQRFIEGPEKYPGESSTEYKERSAFRSLERLKWIAQQGCGLSEAASVAMLGFCDYVPDWDDRFTGDVVSISGSWIGSVVEDYTYDLLKVTPLKKVVETARLDTGQAEDRFSSSNPFSGLSREKPVRAFRALTILIRESSYPVWAWEKYLASQARENDPERLVGAISRRLLGMPHDVFEELAVTISRWVRDSAESLSLFEVALLEEIIERIIDLINESPGKYGSELSGEGEAADPTNQAFNSVSGRLIYALLNDSRVNELEAGAELPPSWLSLVEKLLSLEGQPRSHSIVYCARSLLWFHYYAPEWTEAHILPIALTGSDMEVEAFWGGVFWGGGRFNSKLAVALKPEMIKLATSWGSRLRHGVRILPAMMLSAWAVCQDESGQRVLSSSEFRRVLLSGDQDFRTQTLWYLKRSSNEADPDGQEIWDALVLEYLNDVWPKQLVIRSAATSEALFDLALAKVEGFPGRCQAVSLLISPVNRNRVILPTLRDKNNPIISSHPEPLFRLMCRILPDSTQDWPYGIEEMLSQFVEYEPSLLKDPAYLEIKRKWDSR